MYLCPSFNAFVIKNFVNFIAMTLIIAKIVAVTHNEINENIATVKKTSLFVSLHVGNTALKNFNELQSHCAKNGSDRFS